MTTLLNRLYRKQARRVLEACTLILCRDEAGHVFGGFADGLWRRATSEWFGSRASFLFRRCMEGERVRVEAFNAGTGDDHYLWSDHGGLGFGGSAYAGLLAVCSRAAGTSWACGWTRNSAAGTATALPHLLLPPSLTPGEQFKVAAVECYGFVLPSNFYLLPSEAQHDSAPSVLADKQAVYLLFPLLTLLQNLFLLDLLGKNFSEGERPD